MGGKVAAQQPVEKLNGAGNGRAIPAALLRWSDGRVVILNWWINLHTVIGGVTDGQPGSVEGL
jgi:hypothetical protein